MLDGGWQRSSTLATAGLPLRNLHSGINFTLGLDKLEESIEIHTLYILKGHSVNRCCPSHFSFRHSQVAAVPLEYSRSKYSQYGLSSNFVSVCGLARSACLRCVASTMCWLPRSRKWLIAPAQPEGTLIALGVCGRQCMYSCIHASTSASVRFGSLKR